MTTTTSIIRFSHHAASLSCTDDLAIEGALELCVNGHPLLITMRTPGQDSELAAGWMLSEGIIRSAADIAEVIEQPGSDPTRQARVDVLLREPSAFDPARHRRASIANSSCGLCGAPFIAHVLRAFPKIESPIRIPAKTLYSLPACLSLHQPIFQRTGGVHACAIFSSHGDLLALREDVGRHNALDKLAGWALLTGRLPLRDCLLLLSGRVSFEMIQKSIAIGIPIVAAIGAPSSLAVDLARESGMTLAAFLRQQSFNLYCGASRVSADAETTAMHPHDGGKSITSDLSKPPPASH